MRSGMWPQRDMPIGMIASLIICTVLYMGVAIVLTGIVDSSRLGVAEPLALAMQLIHLDWAAGSSLSAPLHP